MGHSRLCIRLVAGFVLSTMFIVILSLSAFAVTPKDIKGHWAEKQITGWLGKGLTGGYPDATFKPNDKVTRAEFVALINRSFKIDGEKEKTNFTDILEGDWFYSDVVIGKNSGYISGYSDRTFRPNQAITRQEASGILIHLLKLTPSGEVLEVFEDYRQVAEWAKGSVGAAHKAGLLGGYPDKTFKPLQGITRAEAVVVLDRALDHGPVEKKPIEEDAASAIHGKVTIMGEAAKGSKVNIFKAGNYEIFKEIKTDENGCFNQELDQGIYDITVTTDEFAGYTKGVTVKKGTLKELEVALEEAAIVTGVLEDKDGNAVGGTTILFTSNPTFTTETDEDGKYTIALLPEKEYCVRAYIPNKKSEGPQMVREAIKIGSKGRHAVGSFQTGFSVGKIIGGGGAGGGGGGAGTSGGSDAADKDISVKGAAVVGEILTADFSGAKAVYQWQISLDGGKTWKDIPGEDSKTYTISKEDVGKYIRVKVTGTGDYIGTVTSKARPVTGGPAININDLALTSAVGLYDCFSICLVPGMYKNKELGLIIDVNPSGGYKLGYVDQNPSSPDYKKYLPLPVGNGVVLPSNNSGLFWVTWEKPGNYEFIIKVIARKDGQGDFNHQLASKTVKVKVVDDKAISLKQAVVFDGEYGDIRSLEELVNVINELGTQSETIIKEDIDLGVDFDYVLVADLANGVSHVDNAYYTFRVRKDYIHKDDFEITAINLHNKTEGINENIRIEGDVIKGYLKPIGGFNLRGREVVAFTMQLKEGGIYIINFDVRQAEKEETVGSL
ncbi:MAG: hypothetical protein GX318_00020 [Clostridia bacterium]|nr:hypothetical protein [Clostridia bacterium]